MFKAIVAATAIFGSSLASAASDPLYDQVRNSRPDGRSITVSNFTMQRDVFALHFDSGAFHLLAPANGKTFGAVFIGKGSYELTPAVEAERRHLAMLSDDPNLKSLRDSFSSAVIFFSDDTEKELHAAAAETKGTPSADAVSRYDDYLKHQKKKLKTNLHLRVAQDLVNSRGPLFIAQLDGEKLPPALIAVDGLGVETMHVAGTELGGEESALLVIDDTKGGYWYLSHTADEMRKGSHSVSDFARALDYTVDTTVKNNSRIEATTIMNVQTLAPELRVLPVNLMPKLRISDVQFRVGAGGEWKPAAWVQEDADEDGDAGVIFPQPLKNGTNVQLKVTYAGSDVLRAGGDKNYFVGARTNWYANLGTFATPTNFDLTYHIPAGNDLVTVGKVVDDNTAGETRTIHAKSEQPLRVAGFNYGKFKKLSRTDDASKFHVDVFTNPGTPSVINEINRYLEAKSRQSYSDTEDDMMSGDYVGAHFIKVDTQKLADSAMVDALNTARTGITYFGALPQDSVNITQQSEWSFGQSWPSLIYLPYIAFLDSTTRMTLGLAGAANFVEEVGPHEFAHQWWGHHVGWASYHDQWLSEGFAEFTAGLVLQQTSGVGRYNRFLENARQRVLEKPRLGLLTNDAVGPITQGWRLNTWKNDEAYQAMIYSKGAYVLHMLRQLMAEPGKANPDERFIAMMSDFAKTYAMKNPSTNDFQRVVEAHITPTLNIYGNGKADWFFAQWVYGTEIPRIKQKLSFASTGGNKYRISGTVSQEGVNANFFSFVPVYIDFDKGRYARLMMVPLQGVASKDIDTEIELPQKPKRVVANMLHDVLTRD